MTVLNALLASGANSRLQKKIVTEAGLTDGIYGFSQHLSNTGLWAAIFSVKPADMDGAVAMVEDEIGAMRAGAFSDEELADAQKAVTARTLLSMDKPGEIADFELEQLVFRGRIVSVGDYVAEMDKVSRPALRGAAIQYLSPDRLVTIRLEPAGWLTQAYLAAKYLLTGAL
jgi:predicted Zn-dependent peptidase